ncbi:MAG: PAS domain S-box protein, partial [Candidatus Heimdallarchaeota archaeon]|nr:PAS domain S-box protein [Candidatus Heimdallarchaeota archaeon]
MRLRELLIIMSLAISLIPVGIIGGFQGLQSATAFIGLIFVVTFIVSAIISYFITRPIETLTTNIDEISKGNLDVKIEKSEIFEINKLSESLNRILVSLKLAIHKVGVKKGEIFEETIKAKEHAEKKYISLLKHLDSWVWEFNDKGTCTFCSQKITPYLGYSSEELSEKHLHDLVSPHHAKHLKKIIADLNRGKGTTPINTQLCWQHKDGCNICTKTTFQSIYDEHGNYLGIRGIHTDITDLKLAEQKITKLTHELTEMKNQMNTIVKTHQMPPQDPYKPDIQTLDKQTQQDYDHTFIFNEQAHIIEADPALYKNLGYSRDEFLNMNLSDLEFLESPKNLSDILNQIRNAGKITKKNIHRRKDGSSIFVTETVHYSQE